jgi:hypothetical protein
MERGRDPTSAPVPGEATMSAFTPGSEAARAHGCICPTLSAVHDPTLGTFYVDDREGEVFMVRDECPMHGTQDKAGT